MQVVDDNSLQPGAFAPGWFEDAPLALTDANLELSIFTDA
jgi:hypothetical protein